MTDNTHMNEIIVSIPPAFIPALDELVMQSGAGTREQWLKNVVKGILFEYQMRKDFGVEQQSRAMQLNTLWP